MAAKAHARYAIFNACHHGHTAKSHALRTRGPCIPIGNFPGLVTSRQSLSFEHTAPSSCVRTKQTRTAHGARGDLNGERSKSAFVDLRHRPIGTYANEPLSGWKSKLLGAVKSPLSHGDRDKLVSQPPPRL